MSYQIDYWDKEGEHLGCSALFAFTGKVYTMDYLEKMAKQEMKDNFFPGAVNYEISTQEAIVE
jgi:hypothetical protein